MFRSIEDVHVMFLWLLQRLSVLYSFEPLDSDIACLLVMERVPFGSNYSSIDNYFRDPTHILHRLNHIQLQSQRICWQTSHGLIQTLPPLVSKYFVLSN